MLLLSFKRFWLSAAAFMMVYIVCYFILLTPKLYDIHPRAYGGRAEARPGVRWYPPPECHEGILPALFTPIFYLDRWIRPRFWVINLEDPAPEWFYSED
jgi:hypothetical protein